MGLTIEAAKDESPLRAANGQPIVEAGLAKVPVLLDNKLVVWQICRVVPAFKEGVILGNDCLERHGAIVDFKTSKFSIDRADPVNFHCRTHPWGVARLTEEVTVPAQSRLRVMVRVGPKMPRWYKEGMMVEMEPNKHMTAERGVAVARSYGFLDDNKTIPVELANPHGHDLVMDAGINVARVARPDIKEGAEIAVLNADELEEYERKHGEASASPLFFAQASPPAAPPDADADSVLYARQGGEDGSVEDALPPGPDFSEKKDGFENLARQEGTLEERRRRIRLEAIIGDLGRPLKPEERQLVEDLLAGKVTVFSDNPGCTTLGELRIPTGNARPVAKKPYRNPLVANGKFLTMLQEWERAEIIRRSKSAWAAPVLLVPKKSGVWRMVVDFRGLNKHITPEQNPVPLISTVLDSVGTGEYFSTLDLTSGYYQLPVAEEDKHKTAFTTPFGLYEFNVCPQGISNAVPTFQRTMELLLKEYIGTSVLVYLDDFIVYSRTFAQHLIDLENVLRCVESAGMTLKLSKCRFACSEVEYLGHIISKDGIKVCPDKVRAVEEFPQPESATNVRSFLGVANFYRRFIKNFSVIARPLYALTKKDQDYKWTDAADRAFKLLKVKLTTAPVLRYPDFDRPFEIHVDACGVGGGAVLCQETANGAVGVVAYWSMVFSGAETRYATVEQECLALVKAVRHFRPYIFGREVKVITDHSPLKWLQSISDPASRLTRWSLLLHDYQLTIEHRAGSANTDADGLSRSPIDLEGRFTPSAKSDMKGEPVPAAVTGSGTTPELGFLVNWVATGATAYQPPQRTESQYSEEQQLILYMHVLDAECDDAPWVELPHAAAAQGVFAVGHGDGAAPAAGEEKVQEGGDGEREPAFGGLLHGPWDTTSRAEVRQALISEQDAHPRYKQLRAYLGAAAASARPLPEDEQARAWLLAHHEEFVLDHGVLHHVWQPRRSPTGPADHTRVQLVVPQSLRPVLLQTMHDDPLSGGHLSGGKTFDKLRDRYWWDGMFASVQEYCRACTTCGSGKGGVGKAPFTNIPLPQRPFELIGMDYVGPLTTSTNGNQYILVVTDYLTRWPEAFAVPDNTAATAARVITEEILTRHGFPERAISDRGAHFCDQTMKAVWEYARTHHITTPAYRPQFNGLTERFNGSLKRMLKMYTDERQRDWDKFLPFVLFAYRTSYQSSLRATPFGLLYGRRAVLPLDAALLEPALGPTDRTGYRARLHEGLRQAYARARRNLERVHQRRDEVQAGVRAPRPPSNRTYAVGDKVWFHTEPKSGEALTKAFKHQWRGPYEVVAQEGRFVWRLKALGAAVQRHAIHDSPSAHAQRLKPYFGAVPAPTAPTYAEELARIRPHMGPLWHHGHNDRCARCDLGGVLAMCDWCNDAYHAECAGTVTPGDAEWACPQCFMDGALEFAAAAPAAPAAGGVPGGLDALAPEDEGVEESKVEVVEQPRAQGGARLLSARELERRPASDLRQQGKVLQHEVRMNASRRQEMHYLVAPPAGSGAYAMSAARWLPEGRVDGELLAKYNAARNALETAASKAAREAGASRRRLELANMADGDRRRRPNPQRRLRDPSPPRRVVTRSHSSESPPARPAIVPSQVTRAQARNAAAESPPVNPPAPAPRGRGARMVRGVERAGDVRLVGQAGRAAASVRLHHGGGLNGGLAIGGGLTAVPGRGMTMAGAAPITLRLTLGGGGIHGGADPGLPGRRREKSRSRVVRSEVSRGGLPSGTSGSESGFKKGKTFRKLQARLSTSSSSSGGQVSGPGSSGGVSISGTSGDVPISGTSRDVSISGTSGDVSNSGTSESRGVGCGTTRTMEERLREARPRQKISQSEIVRRQEEQWKNQERLRRRKENRRELGVRVIGDSGWRQTGERGVWRMGREGVKRGWDEVGGSREGVSERKRQLRGSGGWSDSAAEEVCAVRTREEGGWGMYLAMEEPDRMVSILPEPKLTLGEADDSTPVTLTGDDRLDIPVASAGPSDAEEELEVLGRVVEVVSTGASGGVEEQAGSEEMERIMTEMGSATEAVRGMVVSGGEMTVGEKEAVWDRWECATKAVARLRSGAESERVMRKKEKDRARRKASKAKRKGVMGQVKEELVGVRKELEVARDYAALGDDGGLEDDLLG